MTDRKARINFLLEDGAARDGRKEELARLIVEDSEEECLEQDRRIEARLYRAIAASYRPDVPFN